MAEFYPDPPHLSAFVVPRMAESAALSAAWDVLASSGCVFTGDALVARGQEWFESVSDIERDVIRHVGLPNDLLTSRRVLKVQFHHPWIGTAVLGLASAFEFGEPHPLEVAIYARPLALPDQLWSRAERQAARRLVSWMERLLVALAVRTDAAYGAIGVEARLPTPSVLGQSLSSVWMPSTWFWPSGLGSGSPDAEQALLKSLDQSAVTRSNEGTLFRGWQPWTGQPSDKAAVDRVVSFLGDALRSKR